MIILPMLRKLLHLKLLRPTWLLKALSKDFSFVAPTATGATYDGTFQNLTTVGTILTTNATPDSLRYFCYLPVIHDKGSRVKYLQMYLPEVV